MIFFQPAMEMKDTDAVQLTMCYNYKDCYTDFKNTLLFVQ